MAQMHSQLAILSLETSPSVILPPNLRLSQSTTTATSAIYVTFKVLQLIASFRRRLKLRSRVRTNEEAPAQNKEACQDFEKHPFAQINREIGRRRVSRCSSIAARSKASRPTSDGAVTTALPEPREQPSDRIARLLEQLDQSCPSSSILDVAKSHKQFLARRREFALEELSLRQLAQVLVHVNELLDTVRYLHPLTWRHLRICKGDEVHEAAVDELALANLLHLLLRLQHRLIHLIVARCLETFLQHVKKCQKNREIHCHELLLEYPDAKHPLNTTWPWAIRPSLAVLWGVCWMFYDHVNNANNSKQLFDSEGNMVDVYGTVLVPRQVIDQYGSAFVPGFRRQQRQSRSPFEAGLSDNMSPARTNNRDVSSRRSRSPMGETQPQHGAPSTTNLSVASRESFDNSAPVSFAASTVAQSATAPQQNPGVLANYFSTSLLPQDSSLYDSSGYYSTWEEQQQSGFQNLDDSTRAQSFLPQNLTPSIRVSTTDLPGRAQHNCLAQSRLAPQAAHASLCHNNNTYSPGHLSPNQKVFMHQETETMQVPPSPISAQASPDDTTMGEQQTRKRSHSMMSQTEPTTFQSEIPMPARAPSVTSQGAAEASPGEDFSPRGSRAFKRSDPPLNAMGKYICTYSEDCSDQIFDRKCEWSKHMDKHDRPYRCPHSSCAKLQGFTYSGGLLRHEREVHGKHGGPKAQLMCPHPDCKRHSGKGFTRKENLNEHLRRVHNSKGESSEDPAMQAMQSQSTEVAPGADDTEPPASLGGVHDPALMSSVDVKYHHKDSLPALLEQASTEQENKRLRLENESLKTRILELEASDNFKEERLRSLETTISQLHVKYQAQAASEQLQAAEQPVENGS